MLEWFLNQELSDQIDLGMFLIAVIGVFVTVIGVFVAVIDMFWKKPKQKVSIAGDKNVVVQNSPGTTIHHGPSAKQVPILAKSIVLELSKLANITITPEKQQSVISEPESVIPLIEQLLESQDKETRKAGSYLKQGKITDAVAVLTELDSEQSRNIKKLSDEAFKTKTELAALLYWSNHAKAELLLEQALAIKPDDKHALSAYGMLLQRISKDQDSVIIFERLLRIAKKTNDKQSQIISLNHLGIAYAHLGKIRKALEYHEQALIISREVGDKQREGIGLGNLGLSYAHLGEIKKAIRYYEQALAIHREIGNREGAGTNLGNLGKAYADLGEIKRAVRYFEQALVIFQQIESPKAQKIIETLKRFK
jgi:tetratricopeptide (TPR) repeat protein